MQRSLMNDFSGHDTRSLNRHRCSVEFKITGCPCVRDEVDRKQILVKEFKICAVGDGAAS